MTPIEIAKIFNLVGVTVILVVSLLIASRYPSPFFRNWAWAYVGGWLLLGIEWIATYTGRPTALVLGEIGVVASLVWFFIQAGRALDGSPLPRRWHGIGVGAALTVGGALTAIGLPFQAVFGPFAVVLAVTHVWLGARVIRTRGSLGPYGAWFLGVALIGSGLWCFTYPVVEKSAFAWMGYLVSSVLNLAVGLGLVSFLVEETSRSLREKNDELTRLDALKTAFINTMSHELRTPLTAIMAAGWLLRENKSLPLAAPQVELARTITEQSELLDRLVSEVLDYARIESRTMKFEPAPLDLRDVAERCARAMAPLMRERNITLAVEPASEPVMANVDRERLVQVCLSLLSNAAKFTPTGGTVTLEVWKDGQGACLGVRDTGIGIAPEHHRRVFERFYQVDPSSTRKYGGMGLGLALCRAIVEDGHGGVLQLTSAPGQGSRFVVSLPNLVASP